MILWKGFAKCAGEDEKLRTRMQNARWATAHINSPVCGAQQPWYASIQGLSVRAAG
jgi:hypothetical protein